jgi:glyoxylase-like metal-dependent hydrolase (beta-lactamase superfamily II)
MKVAMLTVGPFQSNCFIVSCEETGEAIIVDAGDDGDRILSYVNENELIVKLIVNTHAHIDHVSALAEVKAALGVPVLMHENEMPVYRNLAQAAMMFGLARPESVAIDRYIRGGDAVTFGKLAAKVVDTPGHSPGGISLIFDGVTPPRVFVGDVLFRGSIGRTDLPGADHHLMMRTLKDVIMRFPDAMVVYSGHGPETTIGIEKRTNPFLRELS